MWNTSISAIVVKDFVNTSKMCQYISIKILILIFIIIIIIIIIIIVVDIISIIIFQLLHKNIDSLEKRLSGNSGTITLKCKDFQIFQLEIPSVDDCLNVAISVEQLSNIGNDLLILFNI